MVSASNVLHYAMNPSELRSIIQWKLYHDPVHQRDPEKETKNVSRCYYFLDMTSRSFSAVIQELHPELRLTVAIFYLCLRGLDTIEDDMTIPLTKKEPLLRNFHNIIDEEGWTFSGNGPEEKDRQLLEEFNVVVTEFRNFKPAYQEIIRDITKKMGNGMADYANNAEHNANGVNTVEDYDLYCHYVAGIVGEGLTRLFVESKLGNPILLDRPELHNSMGLFLQKVNIIRDIREDWEDKRRFWPKEIWSKHVTNFEDLFKPEFRKEALECSSEMVLNALGHANECLYYLAGLKEQSVFNFCAIPQSMAIATLELVFQNPAVFERNIKITKGQACQLLIESSQNLRVLTTTFQAYAHKILRKNNPRDPSFLKISMACSGIEKFIKTLFPEQDPKVAAGVGQTRLTPEDLDQKKKDEANAEEIAAASKAANREAMWDLFYLGATVLVFLLCLTGLMIWIASWAGARFDLATEEIKNFRPFGGSNSGESRAGQAMTSVAHGEL